MLQNYIKVEFEYKKETKTATGTKTETKTETQTFEGNDVVEALRAACSGSGHPGHNGPELVDWIKKSPGARICVTEWPERGLPFLVPAVHSGER